MRASRPAAEAALDFSPRRGDPSFLVRIAASSTNEGKQPYRIEFRRSDSPAFAQDFELVDVEPIDPGESFSVRAEDIDFDGYADVVFDTRQGIANSYAHYWLFEPHSSAFEDLGEFPTFKLDEHTRRLTTYERNGMAGLEYEKREYAFLSGRLTLMKREVQTATNALDTLERTLLVRTMRYASRNESACASQQPRRTDDESVCPTASKMLGRDSPDCIYTRRRLHSTRPIR